MTSATAESEMEVQLTKKASLKEQQADQQSEAKVEETTLIEAYVDFYKFKPYLPDDIYKQVWVDNNKFMVEKHMFSEEFFKFIREITGAVETPVLNKQNMELGYYKDYDKLPAEVRNIFKILIDVQHKIVFDLLSKSFDSKVHPGCLEFIGWEEFIGWGGKNTIYWNILGGKNILE